MGPAAQGIVGSGPDYQGAVRGMVRPPTLPAKSGPPGPPGQIGAVEDATAPRQVVPPPPKSVAASFPSGQFLGRAPPHSVLGCCPVRWSIPHGSPASGSVNGWCPTRSPVPESVYGWCFQWSVFGWRPPRSVLGEFRGTPRANHDGPVVRPSFSPRHESPRCAVEGRTGQLCGTQGAARFVSGCIGVSVSVITAA